MERSLRGLWQTARVTMSTVAYALERHNSVSSLRFENLLFEAFVGNFCHVLPSLVCAAPTRVPLLAKLNDFLVAKTDVAKDFEGVFAQGGCMTPRVARRHTELARDPER